MLIGVFRYQICIRQEEGMCCVSYSLCADETDPWTLDSTDAAATGLTGNDCTQDYLVIRKYLGCLHLHNTLQVLTYMATKFLP